MNVEYISYETGRTVLLFEGKAIFAFKGIIKFDYGQSVEGNDGREYQVISSKLVYITERNGAQKYQESRLEYQLQYK